MLLVQLARAGWETDLIEEASEERLKGVTQHMQYLLGDEVLQGHQFAPITNELASVQALLLVGVKKDADLNPVFTKVTDAKSAIILFTVNSKVLTIAERQQVQEADTLIKEALRVLEHR